MGGVTAARAQPPPPSPIILATIIGRTCGADGTVTHPTTPGQGGASVTAVRSQRRRPAGSVKYRLIAL